MKDFKFFKKQWKFYKFLKILKEILRFFEKIFKIYRNFRENLGKILENFGNMHFNGAPKASAIIKKLVTKSIETCKILKIFMNYESILYLQSKF